MTEAGLCIFEYNSKNDEFPVNYVLTRGFSGVILNSKQNIL